MAYAYELGVLAVTADPRYYPHVERHVYAMRKLCQNVHVLAVFPPGEAMPKWERTVLESVAPEFPKGLVGFARLMLVFRSRLRSLGPDLIEAIDPPCLAPARLALCGSDARLVYFSMEIFPELPNLRDRPVKRWLWSVLERWGSRRAQKVLSVNASVAGIIARNLGRQEVGVVRSIPWKTKETSKEKSLDLHALCGIGEGTPLLVYQGVVEAGRGLEWLADALLGRPQVHLAVMGYGSAEAWARSRSNEQENFHYLGAFPFAQLMALSRSATAGVVCIEPLSESFKLSLPGKLFEYVGNGLPVLGSPLPEIRAHIEQAGVGEVAEDFSVQALQKALDLLLEKAAQGSYTGALRAAGDEWNWERESLKLEEALSAPPPCG